MLEQSEASYDNPSGDHAEMTPQTVSAADAAEREDVPTPEKEMALVKKLQETIQADKKHFKPDFKRMRRDMFMALHGRDQDWSEKNYKANIVGRHINMKVASIYAKNPRVVARRREQMDFVIWDETPESLQQAMMTVQAAVQNQMVLDRAAAAAAQPVSPVPQPEPAQALPPEPAPMPEPPAAAPPPEPIVVDTPHGRATVMPR